MLSITGKITSWRAIGFADHNPYLFYVTKNHIIDARDQYDSYARFVNDANGHKKVNGFTNNSKYVIIDKRVFITAIKDISAGKSLSRNLRQIRMNEFLENTFGESA